jgi:flagellar operon protein
MPNSINGVRVPFVPIERNDKPLAPAKERGTSSFDRIFGKELEKLKMSGHAMERLEARDIELSDSDLVRLTSAVEKAEAKGARDLLVALDGTAFIVNVPNRTVVTAVKAGDEPEKVFTNIDSVVFSNADSVE